MKTIERPLATPTRQRILLWIALLLMGTIGAPALARQTTSAATPASDAANTSMQSGKRRCLPMQGKPGDARHAMEHDTKPSMTGCRKAMQAKEKAKPSMQGMRMGHMQMHQTDQGAEHNPPIGSLPRSDGLAPKPYAAYGVTLRMPNDPLLSKVQLDSLEYVHGREGSAQAWDLRAWAGHNLDRVWLRTEGTRSQGRIEEGDAEVLWGHAISPWWDLMLGARHDLGPGPARNGLAVGVQGIARYQFDYQATLYLEPGGRSALRIRASQEWLFTQRLIVEPEFELNGYSRADPRRDHGAGIADISLTFRLRYEFSRKFAPYVGYAWVRQWGATAGLARRGDWPVLDRQILLGFRVWL